MLGGGATWDLPIKKYDHEEIVDWCKENLTKGTWFVGKVFLGVFEVIVGLDIDAIAFKLRWL